MFVPHSWIALSLWSWSIARFSK